MSVETVKKRTRSKKAPNVEEEVVLVQESAIPKLRKSTSRKKTAEDVEKPAEATLKALKLEKTVSAPKITENNGSQKDKKRKASSMPSKDDLAKQKQPETAGSAILQQATAFTQPTVQTTASTSTRRSLPTEKLSTYRPISSQDVGAVVSAGAAKSSLQSPITSQTDTAEVVQKSPVAGQDELTLLDGGIKQSASISLDPEKVGELKAYPIVDMRHQKAPSSPHTTADFSSPAVESAQPAPSPGVRSGVIFPFNEMAPNVVATNPEPAKVIPHKTSIPPATSLPRTFDPPPAAPRPLRPTQMRYDQLKKDPKFKALSRKYTSLLVAIPIGIFTSYVLYGRYTNQTIQRKAPDPIPIQKSGGVKPRLLLDDAEAEPIVKRPPIASMGRQQVYDDKRLLEE